jgi:hypothetical protein
LGVLAGASAFAVAGLSASRTGGEKRGLQGLCAGYQRLRRIGGTGKARAAQVLEGFAFVLTLRQPVWVHSALCRRLARRGVEKYPALLHPTVRRGQDLLARFLHQRRPRLRLGLSQDGLCCAQGRGDTGEPLRTRIGELREVLGTLEGTGGHKESRAIGDL